MGPKLVLWQGQKNPRSTGLTRQPRCVHSVLIAPIRLAVRMIASLYSGKGVTVSGKKRSTGETWTQPAERKRRGAIQTLPNIHEKPAAMAAIPKVIDPLRRKSLLLTSIVVGPLCLGEGSHGTYHTPYGLIRNGARERGHGRPRYSRSYGDRDPFIGQAIEIKSISKVSRSRKVFQVIGPFPGSIRAMASGTVLNEGRAHRFDLWKLDGPGGRNGNLLVFAF